MAIAVYKNGGEHVIDTTPSAVFEWAYSKAANRWSDRGPAWRVAGSLLGIVCGGMLLVVVVAAALAMLVVLYRIAAAVGLV